MPAEVSPENILDDLQQVARRVSGVPSANEYREHGGYGVSTLYRHFGSFDRARAMAGVDGEVQDGPTDEELLSDLRDVDARLDKTVATVDYQEHGKYAVTTLQRRFDGFPDAREAAGIEGDPNAEPRLSDEELLDDVRRVYEEVGEPPTEEQYKQHGNHGYSTLRERSGSIRDIREEADIPNPDKRGGHNEISEDDLINAIQELAEELGRVPRRQEMLDQGPYSEGPYRRAFGSWNEALRASGYEPVHVHNKEREEYECPVCGTTTEQLPSTVSDSGRVFCSRECVGQFLSKTNSGEDHHQYSRITVECDQCGEEMDRKPAVVEKKEHFFCNYECYGQWASKNRVEDDHPRWKGGGDLYYGPNWQRQRRRRMEQDEFECQRCGMTEEESMNELNRQLDVHHIRSVRSFHQSADDEPEWERVNSLDNLVTLCIRCHRRVEKLPVSPQFE